MSTQEIMSIRDLYLAYNIKTLDCIAKADAGYKLIRSFRVLFQLLEKLLLEAKDDSDQEKAYVLLSRYIEIKNHVVTLANDDAFVEARIGKDIETVTKRYNALRQELIKRYDDLAEFEAKEAEKQGFKPYDKDDPRIFKKGEGERFISPLEFRSALVECEELLIVDIRTAIDFKTSHLKLDNVINIPPHIIAPGSSAHRIGQQLPKEIQSLWDQRDQYKAIVLFDWNSTKEKVSPALQELHKALTQWDYNKKYLEPAVILDGGYEEIAHRYPSMCFNANASYNRYNHELDELLALDEISYPIAPQVKRETKPKPAEDTPVAVTQPSATISQPMATISQPPATVTPPSASVSQPSVSGLDVGQKSIGGEGSRAFYEGDIQFPSSSMSKDLIASESFSDVRKSPSQLTLYPQVDRELKKISHSMIRPSVSTSKIPLAKPSFTPELAEEKPKALRAPVDRPVQAHDGLVGLKNIRNTCYMNSIIQVFKCIPVIKNLFCYNSYSQELSTEDSDPLYLETANLIRTLYTTKERFITPYSFYLRFCKSNPTYRQGNHEDAMEFFLLFINHLIEDTAEPLENSPSLSPIQKTWYKYMQGKTSMFVHIFYHQIRIQQICDKCKKASYKFEAENALVVPVPKDDFRLEDVVSEYLDDFTIEDQLCSECKTQVKNTKNVCYNPPVLIIHLKRYRQDFSGGKVTFVKNNCKVRFPTDHLEFGPEKYSLSGIVLHTGSMLCGHYTAICRVKNRWYEFNDEVVRPAVIDTEDIRYKACAFFYIKE